MLLLFWRRVKHSRTAKKGHLHLLAQEPAFPNQKEKKKLKLHRRVKEIFMKTTHRLLLQDLSCPFNTEEDATVGDGGDGAQCLSIHPHLTCLSAISGRVEAVAL